MAQTNPPLPVPPGLTHAGCRQRLQRLRHRLGERGLDGALLTNPRYVHYFTGHWNRYPTAAAVYIPIDGPVVLSTPNVPATDSCADEFLPYQAQFQATLIDDQLGGAIQALVPAAKSARRLGCDLGTAPWFLAHHQIHDINDILLALRRTKDADEIALMRHAIAACETTYAAARKMLVPGINEVQIYARLKAVAIEAVGEPIDHFGNDFQAGTGGGPPRNRAIEAGELMPLDLSVIVRGYWSDNCRTFCIGGKPTPAQVEARRMVIEALDFVERTAKAGTSCRKLYHDVHAMLHGKHGWEFGHHLGHGFGLAAHETPRLNPHWDDTLQAGDTLTCEPGIYSDELRGGVRIEQDYIVTTTGLERLTSFPTEL